MLKEKIKINILGEVWTIEESVIRDDETLDTCDGYCDKTARKIVVAAEDKSSDLEKYEVYLKKVIRHEIIHAFLFESGLAENWSHTTGHDESYVDWIATQWPKIARVYAEVGVAE